MPVRRVRRIIRRVDPWTVLKVSLVFNTIAALAFVLGSVIFWSIFINAGIPDKIIDFVGNLGIVLTVEGDKYFRVVVLLSVVWAILATGLLTIGAVLYNLIADTVGGVEVVVLEEVIGPVAAAPRASGVRRRAKATQATAEGTPPRTSSPPVKKAAAESADVPTEETSIAGR